MTDDRAELRPWWERAPEPVEGEHQSAWTPAPAARPSDARLKALISERLLADRLLDASRIVIAVSEGAVVLTGQIPRSAQRALAETVARGVGGVVSVENRLALPQPVAPHPPPLFVVGAPRTAPPGAGPEGLVTRLMT